MRYTDAALDTLRLEGDPLADKVVTALMENQQVEEVDRVLRDFQNNTQPIPSELPPLMQEYLEATEVPPAWTDYERLKRAHAFFLDDGLNVSAVLSLGAMVGCYAVPHGAKLLSASHRLNHPKRRVAETGQFCMYMMDENAFTKGSQFIPSIQKVRLVHAAVRYLLSQNESEWPKAQYGIPICQEDMLGALMLFSSQVLEGLKRLDVPVTAQEAEDYYYAWRVAGVMLGIRADIIPETVEDAHALNDILKHRHLGPSPEGVELTRELLEMYEDMLPTKVFDGVVPAMVRYVVQDEIADWMQVPHTKWYGITKVVSDFEKMVGEVEHHNSLARQVLDKVAAIMMRGQLRMFTNGERANYDIPPTLEESWQLKFSPVQE